MVFWPKLKRNILTFIRSSGALKLLHAPSFRMSDKPGKIGFNIKLTPETCEKLKFAVVEDENKSETSENAVSSINNDDKDNLISTDSTIEDEEKSRIDKSDVSEVPLEAKNDEYAQHVHYEGDVAVYTDPCTNQLFIWSKDKNEWSPKKPDNVDTNTSSQTDDDETKNFGFENNTHTYKDTDGSEYIWDEDKKAWFPKVDDDFLAHYQMAYGFVDNTSKDEKCEVKKDIAQTKAEIEAAKQERKRTADEAKWFEMSQEQNTKVYVSNLPLDITEEEFMDLMQKCGLVMKDPSTQKMKIKLYTKPNSEALKGDALCTYIRVESVDLALKILDGYVIRNHRISVQRAQFQMKGDYNPALKPKKKRRKDKEKLKKIQEKLFDWRPEKMRGERAKHERVVIIKNLFEPSLFDAEVHLLLEYQQDLREECNKYGEVKKVTLYDRHPEGVAQIAMKDPEEAENVVKLLNGRWFGKRQLTAEIWDGRTKYRMEETDADLNKRIDDWNKFLEDDETKESAKDE